ncbi:helix-turn-helix domain-containing protein [Chitinophaga sp. 30R24]|uniref:helix-turn-helix domain-containing protein n=1 Tax=Chitinophaga sp. 30R24 TaxID=3248838 RepID=UPI003B90DC11
MNDNEADILKKLGRRIRTFREAQGLTLLDIEIETGIHNGHLSLIENGQKKVQFFTIYRIAKALKVPFSALADF